MQQMFKYIAIIIACGTLIYVIVTVRSCVDGRMPEDGAILHVPKDSGFSPIAQQEYRPPSLPFSRRRLQVKLPAGVSERDVRRVVTVRVRDSSGARRLSIIEARSGETYVPRDSAILGVEVTDVLSPIFAVGVRFGIGLTATPTRLSPAAFLALVEWDGWLQVPVAVADLDGLGIGGQLRIYHDICFGATHLWRFDQSTQAKATLSIMF